VLCDRVYIKEVFAARMQEVHAVKEEVAYIGWKEKGDIMQLYTWRHEPAIQEFQAALHQKLERTRRKNPDAETDIKKKRKLREYLVKRVPLIAAELHVTVVTDFDKDHLLTVKANGAYFVYFGAMTKGYVHVACWLRIPLKYETIDEEVHPKIFFWVLHTSYAQELEALGDISKQGNIDMLKVRPLLDLTDGIDYEEHE
jgi:hypothetical protein